MTYKTRQKEDLVTLLMNNSDVYLSLAQIKELLIKENKVISQATLYRNLNTLLDEGIIKKYLIEDKVYYQYASDCSNHYHLLCTQCNKIIHLTCKEVKALETHLKKAHGFTIDKAKVVFYGKCKDCEEKDND